MSEFPTIAYRPERLDEATMLERARSFQQLMELRRTVRDFSDRTVPRELIEAAIMTASSSPSGAHRQPWCFVAISDPAVKRRIRIAAEAEERESYEGGRMPPEWLAALEPLGTDWHKPFLEVAPWIVVVFEEVHGVNEDGTTRKNYYVKESVGMACGLFIAALHNMGLSALTHTPSPMGFLAQILQRPGNEKPYVLIPVGYASEDCRVPDIQRKTMERVAVWY